ncbi:FHA domain-containing protein [Microbacterium sp. No. 7]|uniref:FHA domain-containing protein n=1 Tax=Microbacterium sp. No. 7 TaxID=1714373 RepID=UPI0006D02ED5|nr:FHA domain-containing protein [Microbacterium sp. No. 7]ALJ20540.1 hypothetical protein AOA12_11750 [Microbacterium sp. No. 7]
MNDQGETDRRETPADGAEPTTTHAAWGAGHPRLLISSEQERLVHELHEDRLLIGSSTECALQLPGTDSVHATIVHDERDEYVLTLHGEGEMNANPDAAATHPGDRSETLRTGAQFTAGPWRLVFTREEFADHGRPYGGREGGELSDQPLQPPRPDYTGRG